MNSLGGPPETLATYTRRVPSGEIANVLGVGRSRTGSATSEPRSTSSRTSGRSTGEHRAAPRRPQRDRRDQGQCSRSDPAGVSGRRSSRRSMPAHRRAACHASPMSRSRLSGVLLEALLQQPLRLERGTPSHRGSVLNHRGENRRDVVADERLLPGEHLVEHDTEGPDVGAFVDGLSARLFRAPCRRPCPRIRPTPVAPSVGELVNWCACCHWSDLT